MDLAVMSAIEATISSLSLRLEKRDCVTESMLSALCLYLFFLLLSLDRKLVKMSFYLSKSLGLRIYWMLDRDYRA